MARPAPVSRRKLVAAAAGLISAIVLAGVLLSEEALVHRAAPSGGTGHPSTSETTPASSRATSAPPASAAPSAAPLDSVFGSYPGPVAKEIALELVSTAENSTKNWRSAYPYIEDIGDGRGYTAGIVGFCSGTGDMLDLVRYYTSTTPGNPLQRYLPALKTIMAAPDDSRPGLSHALLGAAFTSAWRTAARSAAFQAAQRRERDRVYWDPALSLARKDGLSATGLYIYYDISVNHGPGLGPGTFRGIVASVKARGYRSPAQGGNQVAYLNAISAARSAVLRVWDNYQVDGRNTIGERFLKEANLTLELPLRWSVYGNDYAITTPPTP